MGGGTPHKFYRFNVLLVSFSICDRKSPFLSDTPHKVHFHFIYLYLSDERFEMFFFHLH